LLLSESRELDHHFPVPGECSSIAPVMLFQIDVNLAVLLRGLEGEPVSPVGDSRYDKHHDLGNQVLADCDLVLAEEGGGQEVRPAGPTGRPEEGVT
jgi:hypothetical protein